MECSKCHKDVLDVILTKNGNLCSRCITSLDVRKGSYWYFIIKNLENKNRGCR